MIEINAESIREMPNEVDFAQMDEDIITEPYQDVEIHIRAKDIDRNKMGWAGVIAGVTKQRIKMEVYPSINRDEIYDENIIKGDIILQSKIQPNGTYKPYIFHLIKLNGTAASNKNNKPKKNLAPKKI